MKAQVVIFDDGLQDRSIKYDIKICCFNSYNWIGNGCVIPAGPLREKISSLKVEQHQTGSQHLNRIE